MSLRLASAVGAVYDVVISNTCLNNHTKDTDAEVAAATTTCLHNVVSSTGIPVTKVTSCGILKPRYITISNDRFGIVITHQPITDNTTATTIKTGSTIHDHDDSNPIATTTTPVALTNKLLLIPTRTTSLSKNIPFVSLNKGIRGRTKDYRTKFIRYIDVANILYISTGIIGTRKLELYFRRPRRFRFFNRSNLTSRTQQQQQQEEILIVEQIVSIGFIDPNNGYYPTSFDILIPDVTQRTFLVEFVRQLHRVYNETIQYVCPELILLRYIQYDIISYNNSTPSGSITISEFYKICERINFCSMNESNKQMIQEILDQYYTNNNKEQRISASTKDNNNNTVELIHYHDIGNILVQMKRRSNQENIINSLWDDIFGCTTEFVTVTNFRDKFLYHYQKETNLTDSDISIIFQFLHSIETPVTTTSKKNNNTSSTTCNDNTTISRDLFELYLYHPMNDAYNPTSSVRPIPSSDDNGLKLDRPICEYWINSSHRTYDPKDTRYNATKDGVSPPIPNNNSVEIYTNALYSGCRCLEVSCYDGNQQQQRSSSSSDDGTTNIPIAYNGYTLLTSQLRFDDIIRVVNNFINENPTTYPIILSLEVHCSVLYQRTMATILQSILLDKLYKPPLFVADTATTKDDDDALLSPLLCTLQYLPSPEELRGKVVLQWKHPPDPSEEDDNKGAIGHDNDFTKTKQNLEQRQIDKELTNITLFHVVPYKEIADSKNQSCCHLHDIDEFTFAVSLRQLPKNYIRWREYNTTHMTRIDPCSYYFLEAWGVGCQLVSLNQQTYPSQLHGLILNNGLFRQNRSCGYVHKPPAIRMQDVPNNYSTTTIEPRTDNEAMKLRIRIVSGSCLPQQLVEMSGEIALPSVQVRIDDVKCHNNDERNMHRLYHFYGTDFTDNGYCPVWNELKPHEFTINSPSVAFVQFKLSKGFDVVGNSIIPIHQLRPGYRSVQLNDPRGHYRPGIYASAALLVEIQIDDY